MTTTAIMHVTSYSCGSSVQQPLVQSSPSKSTLARQEEPEGVRPSLREHIVAIKYFHQRYTTGQSIRVFCLPVDICATHVCYILRGQKRNQMPGSEVKAL